MLPHSLALLELLGWQEPGQQKCNFEKWLVNVILINYFVATINMHKNIMTIIARLMCVLIVAAKKLMKITFTNHFSKLPFCWPGSCQPINSCSASDCGSTMCLTLQSRGNLWHPPPEDSNAVCPFHLGNRCMKPVVSDDRTLRTAVTAAAPEMSRLFETSKSARICSPKQRSKVAISELSLS